MFQRSPVSRKLLRYSSRKFGEQLAPKVLLKCCAVVSCKLDWPRVSVLDVAPTRGLKSFTSHEVMSIFDDEFWLDLKSDFTMNSLRRYAHDLKSGKCLFINDCTTLFASKSQRTKDRLVGGLSELLSDESYKYQDYRQSFTLSGKVTVVMNLTSEAYQNYKDRLLGLTLSERLLTVHHTFNEQQRQKWVAKEETVRKMRWDETIREDDIHGEVEIQPEYLPLIQSLSKRFSYASLSSPIACQDLIKATVRAHASLNRRSRTCSDDIAFAVKILPYLTNPFSPFEGQIVRYYAKGSSVSAIQRELGKPNYKEQVQRVIRKAKLRGVLDA